MAGQCRTNPWPAVPGWSWCRNAAAGLTQLTTGKNADAELTFPGILTLRHWRCLRFHRTLCGHEGYSFLQSTLWTWGYIPFYHQQGLDCGWSEGVSLFHSRQSKHEGVSLFHSRQSKHEGVSLFSTSSVEMRLYPFPKSTVWTMYMRVYFFLQPTAWT